MIPAVDMERINPFLRRMVGQPWDRHGLHCWRVVCEAQAEVFGRVLPFADHHMVVRDKRLAMMNLRAADYGWAEIGGPEHGAVARLHRVGSPRENLEHAGVWFAIGPGFLLHSDHEHGVVLDTMQQLSTVRGWVPRWFVPRI